MEPATDPFAALRALRATMPDEPESENAGPTEDSASTKLFMTLFYERKGRGGKDVTIVEVQSAVTAVSEAQVREIASDLKKALATGGSVCGNEILLQGDRREALRRILAKRGYAVKG